MKIKTGDRIFFLGIGGIGMSALARYARKQGAWVSGYDRTATEITDELIAEGIPVIFKDDPELLPDQLDLVVFTPAIPNDSLLLDRVKKLNIQLLKRAQLLGVLSESEFTIAIAGTHGKTSITALTAWILHQAGIHITAFIGGVSKNFNSNLVLDENPNVFVVEADEFDRSFMYLKPDMAVISAIEADHLDIYGDATYLCDAFREFANRLPEDGYLVLQEDQNLRCNAHLLCYGFSKHSATRAQNIVVRPEGQYFELVFPDKNTIKAFLPLAGKHNLSNALAAASVAWLYKVIPETIAAGLASFKGIKRRFDIRVNQRYFYVDDYAHHPTEIKACLQAVRSLFPNKRITAVFQPHLYSRTRDFMADFARSLEAIDDLILLDIYPARELPIPEVSSEKLLQMINLTDKKLARKEHLLELIDQQRPEVLVTMGAGDIDRFVKPLEKMISQW
ncbi:MAG: UDP-N-acetylmuramate--L-alanine ligase [Bacteroidales bacterium]|mgnify:CR=1 FL=1|jgi:UDP-N-acetylmuramate--alanine ligase|nr:UDP-N-acetylmuramate--L-alanine ligase [Bacteroidales bacterium]HOI31399.1 UDP-N-acetylmuramate--L-alanine ligase [Bacteroidales bacterium]